MHRQSFGKKTLQVFGCKRIGPTTAGRARLPYGAWRLTEVSFTYQKYPKVGRAFRVGYEKPLLPSQVSRQRTPPRARDRQVAFILYISNQAGAVSWSAEDVISPLTRQTVECILAYTSASKSDSLTTCTYR